MQGNGFKIAATVFFLVLCGYYLYPSVQNLFLARRLSALDTEERVAYVEEHAVEVEEIRTSSLKLGLDLRGGMHVTMEVQTAALLRALANETDETFNEVLQAARERVEGNSDASVIEAFVEIFEARDPDARLSRYFRSEADGITRRSSNEEVLQYLQQEADEAVDRAIEIIRSRVNRYGVTEPDIQQQGERRIVVELPGVDDEERVRNLLEGTARLEFHLTADPQRLAQAVQRIIQYYEEAEVDSAAAAPAADTTAAALAEAQADTAAQGTELQGTELTEDPEETPVTPQNPFLAVVQPLPYQQSVVFGRVLAQDTSRVNELLARPEVQDLLPTGVNLLYAANPVGVIEGGQEVFELIGVREEVELSGEVITDASVTFGVTNQPAVSLSMNSEGARIWGRLTGANVGRQIAIVLDNVVYSYPVVEERILGGQSQITGLESRAEAQDIVNILKSGALPAPVDIIGERVVGPSLGEAAIDAGLTSVLVGLLLVALFMIMYYRTGGVVADIALLLNLIFLLGILAGFNATLTLPGIAGIVLTIGMAVDANVLIFERIREELDTGKTLKAAIDAGYSNALSAIMDGQITTFFVGVILFSFGVGPIKGFAVTLMAGILTSLFTAIIVTRVIFDYLVEERGMAVNYG